MTISETLIARTKKCDFQNINAVLMNSDYSFYRGHHPYRGKDPCAFPMFDGS
jgi:hypothetical protein